MDVHFFVENVKHLLDERGISYSRAGIESGAGIDFVRNMERKGTEPSIGKVMLMANYLNVTVSELLGEEKEPPTQDGELSERDLRLIKWFRSLPPEKQKAILIAQDGPIETSD